MDWISTETYDLFFGENSLLKALILFIILDYITGVCVAIQKRKLSSQIGAKGITKKIAIFVVISLCHILDTYLLDIDSAIETMSTVFYLSNEGISILENAGQLGLPLPEKISNILSSLKHRDE